ncbi:MAG: winged helix-turn-helix transcriptional regulator [Candidatus Pacebacteria bacterium]|nr:winged helix-turn-helix transcriptional regulator [Candidatus Paceibacterota bacterium]
MALATKGPKKLERHFKGVANHTRIRILFLIRKSPGMSLVAIADGLKANIKTVSEHTRRLALAGLIEKVHEGRDVHHKLSRYGKIFMKFIDEFSALKPEKGE